MQQEFSSQISPPLLIEGSNDDLGLESKLLELPLYEFSVEMNFTGKEVAEVFEKYPLLPGAILLNKGKYAGMISRRQLLEFLIRPFGKDLFFHQPLSTLYSYARTPILELADTTSILCAMQFTLRRSPEFLSEPIVVKTTSDQYRLLDMQELNIASWQIRGIETQVRYERSQAQIIQNDKMASLGRLVDGVAHEILDPVNFIWGNVTHVSNYSKDLIKLIEIYDHNTPNTPDDVLYLKQDIEFDFLESDLSQALASIRTGAERLKKLVTGLQNFCHIDAIYPKPVDLHANLDSTILLIGSRLKGEINIIKKFGHLPPVYCFSGQLNQVFMNILSRAVDTLLDEAVRQQFETELSEESSHKPTIEIITKVISQPSNVPGSLDFRWVSICIADNGPAMSYELQQQIKASFSVDKKADKETSLAVSYRIVTGRHGGKLNFFSQLNKGTEFEILLPLV
ncbi:sensor histidine kinase [Plectonema cf. radiosum LEGE 06105]|uniref:Sensor histidine kinase n=1 Tax=Plectonema cf. radiosum LEGE 06105 TaxID=945769 RepID=A0A8J7F4B2_9CYAN|nr:ATP-binding protein [Plectonema radiosum]MBE9213200.1 sensor histidine kinase [Plectonema cf. radiosum LEGE 06105]